MSDNRGATFLLLAYVQCPLIERLVNDANSAQRLLTEAQRQSCLHLLKLQAEWQLHSLLQRLLPRAEASSLTDTRPFQLHLRSVAGIGACSARLQVDVSPTTRSDMLRSALAWAIGVPATGLHLLEHGREISCAIPFCSAISLDRRRKGDYSVELVLYLDRDVLRVSAAGLAKSLGCMKARVSVLQPIRAAQLSFRPVVEDLVLRFLSQEGPEFVTIIPAVRESTCSRSVLDQCFWEFAPRSGAGVPPKRLCL
ncbi:unnamed protein product [Polarella glacialis]|uniref:Uncharacterized protein n=1 Tax=Polarella glacialis TaxID=89957 RepID=A0A813L5J7_POLGL|nr:unnamed protein product [Polarella glacialis]CAE8720158.1 unnamed protein product [Polarella glacialis]